MDESLAVEQLIVLVYIQVFIVIVTILTQLVVILDVWWWVVHLTLHSLSRLQGLSILIMGHLSFGHRA